MSKTPSTTRDWRAIAKIDPLYGVASWPGKRGAWEHGDFYAIGRDDFADALAAWRQYEPRLGGRCLEIGCGAGRMTAPIALAFSHVVAVDVAPEMIELARAVAPSVEYLLVSGTELPISDGSVDAVFTTHVLQHLDSFAEVRTYLSEVHRALSPAGTGMLHVGLGDPPSRLRGVASVLRMSLVRLSRRLGGRSMLYHTRHYPAGAVRGELERIGFVDVELRVVTMRSNGDPHPFWLVRKFD